MGYHGTMTDKPRRLKDGRILARLHGVGPNGEIADGLVPIGPDHPMYATWDQHLTQRDQRDQTTTN